MTEDQLQAKCYQWAYNTYPAIRGLLFSVPNGSSRDIREAVKLKATGLTPGIPDMILIHIGSTGPNPIGFEFKTNIGILSEAQKRVHVKWQSVGVMVHVIRNFEQWCEIIKRLYL